MSGVGDDAAQELEALLSDVENALAIPEPRKRQGMWRPGVEWRGDEGTLATDEVPADTSPDWDDTLRKWDLDPAVFAVVEPVLFNAWDAAIGNGQVQRMRQWKAKVVRRRTSDADVDIERLLEEIARHKPTARPLAVGEGSMHVVLADWQIGKTSNQEGTENTVARVLRAIDDVEQRLKDLRKIGRPLGALVVEWPGDSVEGCIGHYAMQTFGVDLDRREQMKVTRRLLVKALQRWSRLASRVLVLAVGGNHGENRFKGKAFTTFTDNDDLAVVEQAAEILAANPEAYGHVEFGIARDGLTVSAEVSGWIVGVTHGHVARETGNAEMKLRRWFEKQAGGKQAIGDADILVTGHYHHLRAVDFGGWFWLQAPTLDVGSDWWGAQSGEVSIPGTLTFCSYPERRVADLAVL